MELEGGGRGGGFVGRGGECRGRGDGLLQGSVTSSAFNTHVDALLKEYTV
jgi:hypothetical protein